MISPSSLPRLLGASIGFVLVALAASALSTGVGSRLALDVDREDAETEEGAETGEDEEDDEEDDPDEDGAEQTTTRAKVPPTSGYLAKSVVSNNPFCPSCRVVEASSETKPDPNAGPQPTTLPLELIATMVTKPTEDSIAIIANTQTLKSAPFGPEDHVSGNVVIESVSRTRVMLRNEGRLEFLDLGEGPGLSAGSCSPRSPCAEGEGDCDSDADCAQGLVCGPDLGALYALPASNSVCVPPACNPNPRKPMAKEFCSTTCRCATGLGDCDGTKECLPGHVCVDDIGPKFGKPGNWDICVLEHCDNGTQDEDETGVDCGGSACGKCL